MASSLALKRLASANLLPRTFSTLRPVASASCSRFFNADAAVGRYYDDDRAADLDRRTRRPAADSFNDFSPFPFSDVLAPFGGRSLGQLLDMMNRAADTPIASGFRRNWDARETKDGVYFRADMPGLGKEDVKITVEQNTLVIKGESKQSSTGETEAEEEEEGRRYSGRVELPDKVYKIDEIKAEMKNGVLKVFVPKIKEEERTGAIHVNVE